MKKLKVINGQAELHGVKFEIEGWMKFAAVDCLELRKAGESQCVTYNNVCCHKQKPTPVSGTGTETGIRTWQELNSLRWSQLSCSEQEVNSLDLVSSSSIFGESMFVGELKNTNLSLDQCKSEIYELEF